MGKKRPGYDQLKLVGGRRISLGIFLCCAVFTCKHRKTPAVAEEWDASLANQSQYTQVGQLLDHSKVISFEDIFDDGFIVNDSVVYQFEKTGNTLSAGRYFDPVGSIFNFDPLVVQKEVPLSESAKKVLLDALSPAAIRVVPRCSPFANIDGGPKGRKVIVMTELGKEQKLGSNDAECAESDQDCEGLCISKEAMDRAFALIIGLLPVPEKPQTIFDCAADSPQTCGSAAKKQFAVFGDWQDKELRADVRLGLANRLCGLAASHMEADGAGNWQVFNSSKERVGRVSINSKSRIVSCRERVKIE